MTNPPQSTPHSDIDGVHRDEKPNVESANASGEGTETLKLASEESVGKPPHSEDAPNRDDRS